MYKTKFIPLDSTLREKKLGKNGKTTEPWEKEEEKSM
jgi:hypothetical protein